MKPSARFLLAAAALATATATTAQQFSPSYKFLEAVRKADGAEVTEILNQPGQSLINSRDRTTGEGALHIVVKRSDPTYLRFLLQKGANPNLADGEGNTPMLLALNNGFTEGVKILIAYKANVNQANSRGETPLIRAVQMRNLDAVRELLAAGANPDQTDVIAGMSARDYARRDTRSPAIAKAIEEAPVRNTKAVAGPKL